MARKGLFSYNVDQLVHRAEGRNQLLRTTGPLMGPLGMDHRPMLKHCQSVDLYMGMDRVSRLKGKSRPVVQVQKIKSNPPVLVRRTF